MRCGELLAASESLRERRTWRTAVVSGDVVGVQDDAAPARARGEVIVVSVRGVGESDAGWQREVAEDVCAVEVVAGRASVG